MTDAGFSHTSDIFECRHSAAKERARQDTVEAPLVSEVVWNRQFRTFSAAQQQLRQMSNAEMTTSNKLIEVGLKFRSILIDQDLLKKNSTERGTVHKSIRGCELVDWLQSLVGAVLTRSQAADVWQVLVDEGILNNVCAIDGIFSDSRDSLFVFDGILDVFCMNMASPLEPATETSAYNENVAFLECLVPVSQLTHTLGKDSCERDVKMVMDAICSIPRFKEQCQTVKLKISKAVQHLSVLEAGTTLFEEGSPGHAYYVILKGSVEVFTRKKGTLTVLREGNEFGELALLNDAPRLASVKTMERNCHFLVLSKEDFISVLKSTEASTNRLKEGGYDVLVVEKKKSKYRIVSSTADNLVNILVNDMDFPVKMEEFRRAVLFAVPYFISPSDLIFHLLVRYRQCSKHAAKRRRIEKFVLYWLLKADRSETDYKLLVTFALDLALLMEQDGSTQTWYRTALKLSSKLQLSSRHEEIRDVVSKSRLQSWDSPKFVQAEDVAIHLTAFDRLTIRAVNEREFLPVVLRHRLTPCIAKNLTFAIDQFTETIQWVKQSVLGIQTDRKRSVALQTFIHIGLALRSLGNYYSLGAFVFALSDSSLSRLRGSWERVPEEDKKSLTDLESLLDPSRNHQKYRKEIAQHDNTLPFLPIVLKDLTFVHEGNSTKIDKMINFEKMVMMYEHIYSFVGKQT